MGDSYEPPSFFESDQNKLFFLNLYNRRIRLDNLVYLWYNHAVDKFGGIAQLVRVLA